ncbi:hypothetical protein JRO89_XS09G0043900 [Xanthoceras sorbifolium]|nr:hypothetical protein JRO89_XS09G0043900 [Xanthoceras sorbifolium]
MVEKSNTMSISSDWVKFKVKPLDGKSNFTLWQRKMKNILIQQDLYSTISGVESKPTYWEDDKAILLLRALPYSFKHFTITLLFGNETLACDAVISNIISYMKLNKTSEREAQEEELFFKESGEQG